MKFLEYTPLNSLNSFLQHVNLGDSVVEGEIQAYSCKLAGIDKKLSRSLDQEVLGTLASTPPSLLSSSPVGPLTDSGSRKTLIYLILTLNHMYPDYDFSTLRAQHFRKEEHFSIAKQEIDKFLLEASNVCNVWGSGASFLDNMWTAMDEVIGLIDTDVYCYNADSDGDPFADEGNLWTFNYFFYNKKMKRILYFSCRSKRKSAEDQDGMSDGSVGDDDYERYDDDDDTGVFGNDMDMDMDMA
mmetsp:Transcript_22297/g.26824  ORF Transcript_22297/g.26824 Transcript_22297/m.26824 type:complete len:242 (-) Transcript_22297:728-1453(-)|eukprot:CAMPEP_0197847704 /NCGR_PEP_ID=MMETSP1438-20131217/6858_1 /TAXON_ID=1461541 /ORGANISM="Pterosperma sp., Strain CCMP1384" /LENGTH=241 /DNA_ID=CAMNT_0043459707 /DNA_START=60 /DNA_END=785 /DNA_ORIENTATION=+